METINIWREATPAMIFRLCSALASRSFQYEESRCDLFNDAIWIDKHIDDIRESGVLFFTVSKYGTVLSCESPQRFEETDTEERIYRIALMVRDPSDDVEYRGAINWSPQICGQKIKRVDYATDPRDVLNRPIIGIKAIELENGVIITGSLSVK